MMITIVFMPIISLGNFLAPTKKKNSRTKEKTLHQNRERKQMQHTLKNQNKKRILKKWKASDSSKEKIILPKL